MNEKDKKLTAALIKICGNDISNQLEQYVSSASVNLYDYPNNAGEIHSGCLEVDSCDIQKKDEILICRLLVKQLFEVMFAYEDREGDIIDSDHMTLQVCATVLIEGKLDYDGLIKEDYDLEIEDKHFSVLREAE